jgi:Xaa-Pro dipeptidase
MEPVSFPQGPVTEDLRRLDDPAARKVEVERRLAIVRDLVRGKGAAGALLSSRRDFAWLTAGGSNHVLLSSEIGVASVLVTPTEAVVLTTRIEARRMAEEELTELPFEIEAVPWEEPEAIARAARTRAGPGDLLDDAAVEPGLLAHRARLAELDQARLAWLGERAASALQVALDDARPGQHEDEVAWAAVAVLGSQGIRCPVVLAAADERIERYRHPLPAGAVIHRRLMLVLVAERWGLHAALTRIREFEPPDEGLVARIEATRAVEIAMHDATVPGATLGAVLDAARAAYERSGFPDEWRLHHQGGPIGYQARERIATPGDPTLIEAGMAFAWNPSITGAKAEDTFVLGPEGARRIVTRPAEA